MLTKARFLKAAEIEYQQAADFYDAEQPGLGTVFAEAIEATALRAMHYPDAGTLLQPPLRRAVRRHQVDRPFPYDLVATVLDDELVVLAVAHHSREPGYWIARLQQFSR